MTTKILKFSASWCGPCKSLAMVLNGMDLPVPVEEVDVDSNTDLAAQYGIRGVPTMVAVSDSGEISRITGSQTEASIRKWADSLAA
jgi:thioredoxin 1